MHCYGITFILERLSVRWRSLLSLAIINVDMPEADSSKLVAFYDQLQNQTGIEEISFGMGAPSANDNTLVPFCESQGNEKYIANIKPVDDRYLDVYGLHLLAGRWFEDYDYRIRISYWVFLAGGVAAFLIAFFSVAWISVRALENPVNSLKSE